jgi:hypothetical protein
MYVYNKLYYFSAGFNNHAIKTSKKYKEQMGYISNTTGDIQTLVAILGKYEIQNFNINFSCFIIFSMHI